MPGLVFFEAEVQCLRSAGICLQRMFEDTGFARRCTLAKLKSACSDCERNKRGIRGTHACMGQHAIPERVRLRLGRRFVGASLSRTYG